MDGWMDARKPTTIGAFADVPPGRTRRCNDDLNAGNETNGNSRARYDGVRPPTRVASTRIAGVETVAEKALWLDVGKNIFAGTETDERRDDETVD